MGREAEAETAAEAWDATEVEAQAEAETGTEAEAEAEAEAAHLLVPSSMACWQQPATKAAWKATIWRSGCTDW